MYKTTFFGQSDYEDLEDHPLIEKKQMFLTINVLVTKQLGANAASIYAALSQRMCHYMYVCKHNKWWFEYSQLQICKKTGLSIDQVRYALEKLERFGIIETSCMDSKTGQKCYRLVPTDVKNGELVVRDGYYKALGIPKENYITINPIPYNEKVYEETGEFVLPKSTTPRRRSVPGTETLGRRGGGWEFYHLDGKIPTPSEQKLEAGNQPELLAKQDSPRARVIKEYNINKIGVTSDTDLSLLGESNNSWEDTQNNKKQPPKPRTFVPSQREIQYTEYVLECILENFPNMSQDAQNKIKQSGPKAVRQLANKFGFRTVKDVLNWGLNDPFWKKQIRSLSPLLRPSKSHPEFKKFEMIKMAYEEQAKDPEDTLEEDLESLAKTLEKTPEGVEELIDCVHWFQDEVDEFNENKIVQVRWTHSDMLLKVLKWLHFIESRIIENEFNYDTWDDIVVAYLEYLKRFVLTSPDRPLYAGFFDPKKSTFQNFVAYLEKKHGTEILDL